jgi:hypothetical protein
MVESTATVPMQGSFQTDTDDSADRLRVEWKRHAARTIASHGGTLEEQMRRAERYAEAESVHNPKRRPVEQMSVPIVANNGIVVSNASTISNPSTASAETTNPDNKAPGSKLGSTPISMDPQDIGSTPLPAPLRLPEWEAAELSYFKLAIANLNILARSYNLMAPELAKKPYFSLVSAERHVY